MRSTGNASSRSVAGARRREPPPRPESRRGASPDWKNPGFPLEKSGLSGQGSRDSGKPGNPDACVIGSATTKLFADPHGTPALVRRLLVENALPHWRRYAVAYV